MASLKASSQFNIFIHILLFFVHGVVHSKASGFSLNLIPWDSIESPLYQPNLNQTQKIQMMAMTSKERAAAISPTPENNKTLMNANKIQIPVKSNGLQYSVQVKIGNPSTKVTLLLDTGGGSIWTQCNPSGPYFNPMRSKTYKLVHCQHPLCQTAEDICQCIDGQCVCTLRYGLSSHIQEVKAVLSADSFTLPLRNKRSRTFPDIIFGCADRSPVFNGILGMDKLPVSLISQVKGSVQGRYSYCLHEGNGYLTFGNDIPKIRKDVKTTPILNPSMPYMFLGLTDISVAGTRLGIDPFLFSKEQGGLFIDTGGPFTVLKKQAYNRVIQEFKNYFNGKLKRVNLENHFLKLCYKTGPRLITYPSITFHLQGADYETSHLYVTPKQGIMCIGIIPGEVSLLGAMQQWNKRFVFDINRNVMQFVDEDCSKERTKQPSCCFPIKL